ncbi:tripartite tricarboxylate transporter substrate binding protein [Cupriavidus respiraculi]|uniref:Tripartite tricarboxylate transporter substrate binding protein n=1 Tax=Cupriavidus respiraculi TaxID=195930 RepID=A0ABM8XFZ1_9BURK|nr:tripartite tricarboxylate transporter substrate binding protein [Cupriavidus respiraculi]MBY4948681.1 tripartite tricarboxylate transporter substrate binding protein [Cupriavidus respiraculi]CAG9179037.1 hypothetical protein LMG21510_03668 [Cupriavidus respiraculi]
MQRRHFIRFVAAAACTATALGPLAATAQDFPNRPIRLIVPYGAGGVTDQVARALADAAGRELGQTIVVENKPGVSGTLGATQMVTTEPDGYTLSMAPVVIFRLPHVQKMRYDPLKDLTYISMVADYNFAVAVKTDAKWQTMQELMADAKASKKGISYGTTGIYGSQHLTISELARVTQSNWTHVPYKGDAEAITALLGGSTDVAVLSNTLLPYVQNGQLRVLATLSEKRAADFPNAPTLKEIGYNVWSNSPFGIVGPAGMKPEVVKRLDDAFRNALKDQRLLNVTGQFGMVTNYMGPQQYDAYAQKAFKSEGEIIKRLSEAMKNQ